MTREPSEQSLFICSFVDFIGVTFPFGLIPSTVNRIEAMECNTFISADLTSLLLEKSQMKKWLPFRLQKDIMLIILYQHNNNILISQLEPEAVQWEPGRCSKIPMPRLAQCWDGLLTQAHVSQDSCLTPWEYILFRTIFEHWYHPCPSDRAMERSRYVKRMAKTQGSCHMSCLPEPGTNKDQAQGFRWDFTQLTMVLNAV